MKTGPQMTEQEINSFMDFDALLKQKDALLHRQRSVKRLNKIIGLTSVALIVTLLAVVTWKDGNNTTPSSVEKESILPVPPTTGTDSLQAAMAPGEKVEKTRPNQRTSKETPAPSEKAEVRAVPDPKDETKPAYPVYIQPEPVDGYPALYEYFDSALRYPTVDAKDSVEGIVTVAFVINDAGKAIKITIENSLGDAFDQEARRLIQHMPPWRPATFDGKPVESKVSLPVTFSIQKTVKPQ